MSDDTHAPILASRDGTTFFRISTVSLLGIILAVLGWVSVHILPIISDSHNDGRYVQIGGYPKTGYVTQEERTEDLKEQTQAILALSQKLDQHDGWFKAIWEAIHEQNQATYKRNADEGGKVPSYMLSKGQVPTGDE